MSPGTGSFPLLAQILGDELQDCPRPQAQGPLDHDNQLIFLPSARPLPEDELDELRSLDARLVRIPRPDGRELAAYDAAALYQQKVKQKKRRLAQG